MSVQSFYAVPVTIKNQGSDMWVRDELARYTYKPGWDLSLREPYPQSLYGTSGATLVVRFEAPNTYHPSQTIRVEGHYLLPYYFSHGASDPAGFQFWLESTLMEVERHEMQEWLRRDGALVDDPHAKR